MNDVDDELLDGRKVLGLDGVEEILEIQIRSLSEKLDNGRIKDEKKMELRIKMVRSLAYLVQTYARIREYRNTEELLRRVKILEEKQDMGDIDVKVYHQREDE